MAESRKGGELRAYVALLRRWLWFLVVCAFVGALGGYAMARAQTPVYQATTILVVNASSTTQDPYSNVLASDQVVQTYVSLVTQPDVLTQAAAQVGGVTEAQLAREVSASGASGTELITIQVDDPSPSRSAALANAVAISFITVQGQAAQKQIAASEQKTAAQLATVQQQIAQLEAQIDALRTTDPYSANLNQLQQQLIAAQAQQTALQNTLAQLTAQVNAAGSSIYVAQTATAPTSPDHPKPALFAATGGALGLVLALSVVLLGQFLDDRVRTEEDVKALTGLPTLGKLPALPGDQRSLTRENSPRLAEALRVLRTNLSFLSPDRPLNTDRGDERHARRRQIGGGGKPCHFARHGREAGIVDRCGSAPADSA